MLQNSWTSNMLSQRNQSQKDPYTVSLHFDERLEIYRNRNSIIVCLGLGQQGEWEVTIFCANKNAPELDCVDGCSTLWI